MDAHHLNFIILLHPSALDPQCHNALRNSSIFLYRTSLPSKLICTVPVVIFLIIIIIMISPRRQEGYDERHKCLVIRKCIIKKSRQQQQQQRHYYHQHRQHRKTIIIERCSNFQIPFFLVFLFFSDYPVLPCRRHFSNNFCTLPCWTATAATMVMWIYFYTYLFRLHFIRIYMGIHKRAQDERQYS